MAKKTTKKAEAAPDAPVTDATAAEAPAAPKAARKRKAAKPKSAGLVIEETPEPKREPDEPELQAASAGIPERVIAARKQGEASAVAAQGELEAVAEAADTFEQAFEQPGPVRNAALRVRASEPEPDEETSEASLEIIPEPDKEDTEPTPKERPPARLERLQKILSQAGVASRRHAEEMITEGRVQVNGTVVTELGTKADPEHDHIRVDGKLLKGAERLRYFVLNKPKGYVTTVSDPEGRPTVMEFFKKMSERLYPVGRLDYQSEGLLLVTNDGDLANKLTKAATGVEKTYLVKVSGQPSEEALDRLREGVGIDRGQPGEGRVQTAPATIRPARAGENPWYEVVLTEGRNRELRKMFEEIGHRVEKIRRVGYGPLVLDVEPGKFRELDPEELTKLRLAGEGKWRKPKPKPERKQDRAGRGERRAGSGPSQARTEGRGQGRADTRGFEPRRPAGEWRERKPRPEGERKEWRPARPTGAREEGFRRPPTGAAGSARGFGGRSDAAPPRGGRTFGTGRPAQGGGRAQFGSGGARPQGERPRPQGERPRFDRPAGAGPRGTTGARPAGGGRFDRGQFGSGVARPQGDRPRVDRPPAAGPRAGTGARPASGPGRQSRGEGTRYGGGRPPGGGSFGRNRESGPGGPRPQTGGGRGATTGRPSTNRPSMGRPLTNRPSGSGRPPTGGARPPRAPGRPSGRPAGRRGPGDRPRGGAGRGR